MLGEYDADFHFFVIYYLLRAKAFCPGVAYQIAYYSENVDDTPSTDPMRLGMAVITGQAGAAATLAQYHFSGSTPTSGTYLNEPTAHARAANALRLPMGSDDMIDTMFAGSALHTFADTFAHNGFTAYKNLGLNGPGTHNLLKPNAAGVFVGAITLSPVGHLMYGHAPDQPFQLQGTALNAAKSIYDLIPDQVGCCGPVLPWSAIVGDLSKQLSTEGSELFRSWEAQDMIN